MLSNLSLHQRNPSHGCLLALGVCLLLTLVLERRSSAAFLINNFDADKHERFQNSPSFIGDAYDWSGVGRSSAGSGHWGTLVAPSFMLTSGHFAINSTATFYMTNDAMGATEQREIVQRFNLRMDGQTARSDLALVRLNEAVTSAKVYGIDESPSVGDELFAFGLSNNEDLPVPANVRVGRNQITKLMPEFSHPNLGNVVGDVLVYDYDTSSAGLGDDEGRVSGGDSGGPSFTIVNGEPALLGIHWFVFGDDDFDDIPLPGSGDTMVASFIDEINAAIASTGSLERVSTLRSMPEPTSLGLLVFGSSLLLVSRRRTWASAA